jgi:hypothetical protein
MILLSEIIISRQDSSWFHNQLGMYDYAVGRIIQGVRVARRIDSKPLDSFRRGEP